MKTTQLFVVCLALLNTQESRATDPRVEGFPFPATKKPEELVKLLKSDDVETRREAAHDLYRLRWSAAPAIPALVEAMKDSDAEVRGWAAACFRFLSPPVARPTSAVPVLVQLLQKDDDILVRSISARSLRVLTLHDKSLTKDASPVFLKCLDEKDQYIRLNMAVALIILGDGGDKPVSALAAMLGTKDEDFQEEVIAAVGHAGLPMLPALEKARNSKNVSERRLAPICIISIIEELERKNRVASISTPVVSPEMTRLLGSFLNDSDQQVVINALRGLRAAGGPAVDFAPAITKKLEDSNSDVRHSAVLALGAIGPKAKDSVPAIEKVLSDSNWYVRRDAPKALARLSWKSAIPALEKALTDSHRLVRFAAVETLEMLKEEPEVASALLIKAFKDEDEVVRSKAVTVLSKFKPNDASVVAITKMLVDPNGGVREEAASALGRFGDAAKQSVPELVKTLQDRNCWARCRAAESLGKIHHDAATVVPALLSALDDEHPSVRWWAAKVLGGFGKEARSAIPKLTALLKDPELGAEAKESLKQIQDEQ